MHTRRDFLVGVIFLGAVVSVGYMTIMIKGFSVIFGSRIGPYTIVFPEVAGLETGEEVRAKGVKVGQVDDVKYLDDGTVSVSVSLFADPHLKEDCAFYIRGKSPLGGKYLEIEPGSRETPNTREFFQGERPTDLFLELGKVLSEKREEIIGTLDNLNDTTRAIRQGEGTLGALIYDTALRDNVTRIVAGLKDAVAGESDNLLATILRDAELARNVRTSIMEIKDALGKRDTPLGILIHDEESGRNLKRAVGDVASLAQDVRAGKGTLGPLFTDDTLYRKAVEAVESVATLSHGEGAVAYLLTDPASRTEITQIVHSLRATLGDISQGKGTLGRIITDAELYEKLRALLVQIREAVEDAREHAPINQLVNVIGAVF